MAKTVEVRRGGVYLDIPEDAIERYMAKGYDVVDAKGNVLKQATPNDVIALKKAYEQHVATIKKLEAEIAALKTKLAAVPAVKEAPVVEKPATKTTAKKTSKK